APLEQRGERRQEVSQGSGVKRQPMAQQQEPGDGGAQAALGDDDAEQQAGGRGDGDNAVVGGPAHGSDGAGEAGNGRDEQEEGKPALGWTVAAPKPVDSVIQHEKLLPESLCRAL